MDAATSMISRQASPRQQLEMVPSPIRQSRWRQAWQIASDLLIATALIWMLPLLLGALGAVVNLLLEAR
jgi:hypothetical protein